MGTRREKQLKPHPLSWEINRARLKHKHAIQRNKDKYQKNYLVESKWLSLGKGNQNGRQMAITTSETNVVKLLNSKLSTKLKLKLE